MQVWWAEIAILNQYLACVLSKLRRPGVINTAPPNHGPSSCDTYRW